MDATIKATEKVARIDQLIADHRKRVAVTLQAGRHDSAGVFRVCVG